MAPKKKKKEIKVEVDDSHTYHINGVKVLFPVKAYPSQISIMNKILRGIDQKKNCLLESPTGSGKSLALLCSCLAWQRTEKERIVANGADTKQFEVNHDATRNKKSPTDEKSRKESPKNDPSKVKSIKQELTDIKMEEEPSAAVCEPSAASKDKNDDGDFVPTLKRTRKRLSNSKTNNKKTPKKKANSAGLAAPEEEINEVPEKTTWTMETIERPENEKGKDESKEKTKSDEKVPKIYFGTRTHKQIAQIIRELRKTVYKDVKMSILGSREYLCIHPTVSKSKEKNEECKSLLKGFEGKSCRYHSNVHLYHGKHSKHKFKADSAWDIEDLVTAGKKMKACPYYGSRELTKGAEIIFCPYNYLIDPLIRGQMLIDLKDQIVVLDEAHNIEDSAREAASMSLTMLQLQETKTNLREMVDLRVMVDSHQKMMVLCDGLLNWMESVKGHLEKRGFESEAKVWTGKEMVKMLGDEPTLRLTAFSLTLYKDELQKLINEEQESFGGFDDNGPRVNSKSLGCLSSIIFTLEKLLDERNDFASDYRVALCRTSTMRPIPMHLPGGWVKKSNKIEKVWTYKLNMWCLNPAVVFSEVGQIARTIVVTSGTLSPMTSFSSELGVSFPISLEANHVIDDSQVWVGNVGVGPSNVVINANYKNSETFSFQDEVGKTVLQICKVIPKGVLCFLPSYSMMEKLIKRWKVTGLWNELSARKVVQVEPRAAERTDFDETLQYYYECVNTSYKLEESLLTGALLFAVCRGKVSEGLDFSDDNARAVIVVGIPFPNVKDVQVDLKRKYNTSHVSRGLLNGNDWYEMQAFRALNQAIGRCIRHRNDWGAILMIDERFGKSPKYRDGLSKWVRSRLQRYNDFQVCLTSLHEFVESRLNPDLTSVTLHKAVDTLTKVSSVPVTDQLSMINRNTAEIACTGLNTPVGNASLPGNVSDDSKMMSLKKIPVNNKNPINKHTSDDAQTAVVEDMSNPPQNITVNRKNSRNGSTDDASLSMSVVNLTNISEDVPQNSRMSKSCNWKQSNSPGSSITSEPYKRNKSTSPGTNRLSESYKQKQSKSPETSRLSEPYKPKRSTSPGNSRMSEPCKRKQSTSPVDCGPLQSPKRFQWKRSPLNVCSNKGTTFTRKEHVASRKSLPLSFVANATSPRSGKQSKENNNKPLASNISEINHVVKRASISSCDLNTSKKCLLNTTTPNLNVGSSKTTKNLSTSNAKQNGSMIIANHFKDSSVMSAKSKVISRAEKITTPKHDMTRPNDVIARVAKKKPSKHDARLNDVITSLNDIPFDDNDFEELKTSFTCVPEKSTKSQCSKTPSVTLLSCDSAVSDKSPCNSVHVKTPNRSNNSIQVVERKLGSTNNATSITAGSNSMSVKNTTINSLAKKSSTSTVTSNSMSVKNAAIGTQFAIPLNNDEIHDSQLLDGIPDVVDEATMSVNRKHLSLVAMEIEDSQFMNGIDEACEATDAILRVNNKHRSFVATEITVAMEMDDDDLSMISTQLLTTGKENIGNNSTGLQQRANNLTINESNKSTSFIYPRCKMTSTPKPRASAVKLNIINSISKKFNQSTIEAKMNDQSKTELYVQAKPENRNQSKAKSQNQSTTELGNRSNTEKQNKIKVTIPQDSNLQMTSKLKNIVNPRMRIPGSPPVLSKSKSMIITPPSPDLFDISVFNSQDEVVFSETLQNVEKSPSVVGRNTLPKKKPKSNSTATRDSCRRTASKELNNDVTDCSSIQPAPKNKNDSNQCLNAEEVTTVVTIESKDKDADQSNNISVAVKKQLGTRRKRRMGLGKSRNLRSSSKRHLSEDEDKSFIDLCDSGTNTAVFEHQPQLCCQQCQSVFFTGATQSQSVNVPTTDEPIEVFEVEPFNNNNRDGYLTRGRQSHGVDPFGRLCANVYYEEETNTIYRPLFCKQCEEDHGNESNVPVGFSVLSFDCKEKQAHTYLFKDGIKIT